MKKRWQTFGLPALAVLAVLVGLLAWQWPGGAAESGAPAATAQNAAPGKGDAGELENAALAAAAASGPLTPQGRAARQQLLSLWQQRYNRAEQTYSSYRDATRYPYDSRPLSEHPDQVRPFDPIAEDSALRDASGKAAKNVRLRTTQGRVFLSGAESVKFTVAAVDEQGKQVPLTISRAAAQTLPDTTALIAIIRADVPFNDSGSGADTQAGDSVYSGMLTPAQQGFAQHNGTIRVLADVTANGQSGVASFDVVYTPAVPATWAGVREAQEAGSLNFYLKAQVQTAGRYVVSGRVFDANNQPFALLQFNDEVRAGSAEFKLQVFGALVRDKNPAFPLKLVDVDGYLLRPDTFPDRALMARQPGVVHVSKRYALDSFSPAEWSSEERARYLAEYGKDVQEARDQVQRLQPN